MKRTYRIALFAFCAIALSVPCASAQHAWTWVTKPVGLISDSGWQNSVNGIAIDNMDNRFIVGNFYDSALFGSTKLISYDTVDMYISKLNSAGDFQWTKQIGGWHKNDYAIDVDVDPSGNAYMAGYFADSLDFDGTIVRREIISLSTTAVAKYDGNGNLQWAKHGYGSASNLWGGIAHSPTGHLYVGVGFTLTKYDASNGDSVWTWQVPLVINQSFQIFDVAVDKNGQFVYITGNFSTQATFGSTVLTTPGSSDVDIFVAKFDKDGNVAWAKKAGATGTNGERGWGIEVDGSGNVYVTGYCTNKAHFDSDSVSTNQSFKELFVAKYASNGDLDWVRAGTGPTATSSEGLEVRLVENETALMIAAFYSQNVTYDGTTFSILAGIDPLLLKLDLNGNLVWGQKSGGNIVGAYVTSMDVDRTTSTVSIGGMHLLQATFGTDTLSSPMNSTDGYVATSTTDSPTPVRERPSDQLPVAVMLSQNYPNPFNPSTTIAFDVPRRSNVDITVYNLLGERVKTLVSREFSVGSYTVDWDGTDQRGTKVASGVYLYRIEAGDHFETKKMLLLK